MDVSQFIKWDSDADTKKGPDRSSFQLTDMVVEKLFSMALPPKMTALESNDLLKDRLKASSERPALSIPTMSKNFIQLNSRLSAPFELVNNLIYFLQWKNPFMNITILLIYTNIIITPIPLILIGLPFVLISAMTPNFISCYKPDNVNSINNDPSNLKIKKLNQIKPVSELSREFLINLTDLQNHMLLYVDGWDFIVHGLNKFIHWEDETISSFIFLSLISISILILTFSQFLIKFIEPTVKIFLILFGWILILSIHPKFYDSINNFIYSESTRLYILQKTNKFEESLSTHVGNINEIEVKEVGIFEIWKLNESVNEWNFIGFKNTAFWSNDINRITFDADGKFKSRSDLSLSNFKMTEDDDLGDEDDSILNEEELEKDFNKSSANSNKSTPLNQIVPPKLWKFKPGSKWKVDLFPDNWIKEDLLTEDSESIEIDEEGKWVYDKIINQNRYRRRRWIRDVVRTSEFDENNNEISDKISPVQSQNKEISDDDYKNDKNTRTLKLNKKSIHPENEVIERRNSFVSEQLDYI